MEKKFICNICIKNYKSYQSLWNHNKKKHTQISTISENLYTKSEDLYTKNEDLYTKTEDLYTLLDTKDTKEIKVKKTLNSDCKYCNKKLCNYNSLHRHEKKCKVKLNISNNILNETSNDTSNINELQKLNDMLKKENNNIKQLLNEIIKKPTKSNNSLITLEPQYINKINNILNTTNTTNNNDTINNINNNTINNTTNTTNNITIISLGNEKLNELLTTTEQLNILKKKNTFILNLIEYAHFNKKFPNLHSIILTSYKSNTLYLYDDQSKIFKLINKEDAINLVIENKVCDIEDFYLEHKDKLDSKTRKIIETIIEDRYENDEKETVNKKMRDDINLLLYNNRNTVKHLLK